MTTGVVSTTPEGSEAGGRNEPSAQAYLVRLANGSQPLVASSRHALVGVDIVLFGRGPVGAERHRKAGEVVLRIVLAGEGQIERCHLGELAAPAASPPSTLSAADDARRLELERLLDEHRGNVAAVARTLGKDRVQVRRWLARYGLNAATFKR